MNREEVRNNMIARATDVWGLDYAAGSEGFYPRNDKEFGRRALCPEDLHCESWRFIRPDQKDDTIRITHTEIPSEVFMIIYGIKQERPTIRGVQFSVGFGSSPRVLPYQPLHQSHTELLTEFEVPLEFAPRTALVLDAFCPDIVSTTFYLEVVGEIFAKPNYLQMNFAKKKE